MRGLHRPRESSNTYDNRSVKRGRIAFNFKIHDKFVMYESSVRGKWDLSVTLFTSFLLHWEEVVLSTLHQSHQNPLPAPDP